MSLKDIPFTPPLRVEPSQSDHGGKFALVDATGRLLVKTPSNRKTDRDSLQFIATTCNVAAREAQP